MPTQIFTLSFTARKGDREVKAREDIRAKYLSPNGMDYLEQEMAKRHRADSVEIEAIEQDFYSKRIKIWTKATGKKPEIQVANEFVDFCHNLIEQNKADKTLQKLWEDRLQQFINLMKADNPGIYELVKDLE